MDFLEEQSRFEAAMASAKELYNKDLRTRMIVDSAVAMARGQLGRHIEPERADEEAYEMTLRACLYVASRIYTEDAEIHTLRWERDRYRKLAEELLALRPGLSFIIPTMNETGTKDRNSDGDSDSREEAVS